MYKVNCYTGQLKYQYFHKRYNDGNKILLCGLDKLFEVIEVTTGSLLIIVDFSKFSHFLVSSLPTTTLSSGVHCEGPYISREKKGAHEGGLIQSSVTPELIKACYGPETDNIQIITLAPELDGAMKTIEWLDGYRKTNGKKIVVSLGHSMAQYACAERAVNSGATHITHLFNAMLPVSGYHTHTHTHTPPLT